MHLGTVYVTLPPADMSAVAPQTFDVPVRPDSWTLNHTALRHGVSVINVHSYSD
jgi:hypothetical protein